MWSKPCPNGTVARVLTLTAVTLAFSSKILKESLCGNGQWGTRNGTDEEESREAAL